MSLQEAYVVWSFFNSLMLLFIAVYTWISNRDKVSREAINALTVTVNDIDTRVATVEESIAHVPRQSELNGLHARITKLSDAQSGVSARVDEMNRTLSLIHQYLMNRKE